MTLWLPGATLLLSAGLTRYLCWPKAAVSIIDEPNERSLHSVSTPRTGGLAILGSLAVGTGFTVLAARAGWAPGLVSAASDLMTRDFQAVFLTTLLLAAVSLWDDLRNVSPLLRLAAQSLAAFALVWGADLTIDVVVVPWFGPVPLGSLARPLSLLFILWMTNLYNFMDGLDGLAAGMTVAGFGLMGYLAALNGGPGISLTALTVAAAAAGFLVFNFPPARIFMGDVGSVPLGFLAASLAVKADGERVMGLWVFILLFSPFIVDASVVLVRRALRGARLWDAHREHYYQRLVLAGWSHGKTLWAEYLVMLGCATVAVVWRESVSAGRFLILGPVAAAYLALAMGVSAIERRTPVQPSPGAGAVVPPRTRRE